MQEPNDKKKKKKRKFLRQLIAYNVMIIIGIVMAFVVMGVISVFSKEAPYIETMIEVPKGAGAKQIVQILKEEKIITNSNKFLNESKKKGYDSQFKYGRFKLNNKMTNEEIMKVLISSGEVAEGEKFTIPEGFSNKQLVGRLVDNGLTTAEKFEDAISKVDTSKYEFLKNIPHDAKSLEGYLFPNTYEVTEDPEASEIVGKLLGGFNMQFKEGDLKVAEDMGYTYHEIIIIASLIEKEAKRPEERKRIAGVIYNRLKKKENLQLCSTIQYILGEPKAKLYEQDLAIDSPYNTYKYKGLPKGPICNPGYDSIQAALYPEEHEYFYFVLKNEETGEHYFSKTYLEHVNAKNRYLD